MAWNQSGNIRGASGVPGASGASGASGVPGATGPTGASGASGGTGGTGGPGTTSWNDITDKPGAILNYKGTWNASTNSPSLSDSTGSGGDVYRVTVGGSRNLGSGTISWEAGDYAIWSPVTSSWEKADTTDAVSSVAGRTGAVTLTSADLGASGTASASTFLRGDNTWAAGPIGATGASGGTGATGGTGAAGVNYSRVIQTITAPTTMGASGSTDYVVFLSANPASGDINYTLNSFLFHFDAANDATTFTDTGPNAFSVTRGGGAKISTAQSKFGGSSLLLNGSTDFLSITGGNSSTIPTNGSYCIEAWVYHTSRSTVGTIMAWGAAGTNQCTGLEISTSGTVNHYWYSNDLATTQTVPLNTWTHVAGTFDGTTRRTFIDGTLRASDTPTGHNVSVVNNLNIGRQGFTATGHFKGHMDDVRLSRTARYTASFTAPTAAFADKLFDIATPTLPAASGALGRYSFRNTTNVAITIGASGSQAINGATGGLSLAAGASTELISDGSGWYSF